MVDWSCNTSTRFSPSIVSVGRQCWRLVTSDDILIVAPLNLPKTAEQQKRSLSGGYMRNIVVRLSQSEGTAGSCLRHSRISDFTGQHSAFFRLSKRLVTWSPGHRHTASRHMHVNCSAGGGTHVNQRERLRSPGGAYGSVT